MRHRGFCTWGIQTGPFAACSADFVPKKSIILIFILGGPILITPERGAGNEKIGRRPNGFLGLSLNDRTIVICITSDHIG